MKDFPTLIRRGVLSAGVFLISFAALPANAGEADLFLYGNFGQGTPSIEGTSVSDLVSHENFPNTPGISSANGLLPRIQGTLQYPQPFEMTDNLGDNYGSMTEGYLEVPVTGEYRFFLSSDDGSRLELSSDHLPANMEEIAGVPGDACCQPFVDDGIRSSELIELEKGSQYYFRVLHKEGTGGDWVRVGWTGPTMDEPEVIPMRFVQRFVESDSAPVITKQPESKDVVEQAPVVFTVHVDAQAPVTYQWLKSGEPIEDAVNSSLEMTPSVNDDGATLSVRVSNELGETESDEVTLAVQPDTEAPVIESANTFGNPNALTIEFSEPVEAVSGADPQNYSVSQGVSVESAEIGEDRTQVKLATTEIVEGQPYTLTVDNVRDRATQPNAIASGTMVDFVQAHGAISRKVFTDIPGELVVNLTSAGKFPDSPDIVTYPTSLEGPQNFGSNYGTQFKGFVVPPETGDYTFYISSWAFSELYLSTDADPENKRLIAREPNATGLTDNPPRNWTGEIRRPVVDSDTGRRGNVSEPISLEAGKKYYIEVRHKHGTGSDNIAVTWQKPGESVPEEGASPIQGEFLSAFAALGPVTITKQPQSRTVQERESVTFEVGVDGSPPYSVQWLRDGEPIQGETGMSLTLSEVSLDDNGAAFSARVENRFSEATSEEATLTVNPDNEAPTLVDAEGNADWVEIEFSEPISEESAVNGDNYSINQGIEVTGAELLENGNEVRLTTSLKENETTYTVTVNNVTDLAETPNEVAEDSRIDFTTFLELLADDFEEGELNDTLWTVDDRPFEDGEVEGFEVAQQEGQLDFSMTASGDYWGGVAVQTKQSFIATPQNPLSFEIDRVAHSGSGTAQRTGVWITHGDRDEYVLFAENVGEGGWQFNRLIGQSGDNATGGGAAIDAFAEESFTDQGDHRIRFEANGETVKIFLDGVFGAEVPFPFQEDIKFAFGGYVRATGDTLEAGFDNANVSLRLEEAPISISQQPQDQTVLENRRATFSVEVDSSLPGVRFQWQRNGSDIADANMASYTTPRASLDDSGATYRVVVLPPLDQLGSSVTSEEATLTVREDQSAPSLVSTKRSFGNSGEVTVTFDEPVDQASATDPGNYSISGDVTVEGASMGEEPTTVILQTSPIDPGLSFELTVEGVQDSFGNAITEPASRPVALPNIVLEEDFEAGAIDDETWGVDDRALETGAGDFTQAVEDGELVVEGASTEQWWAGSALKTEQTFAATPRNPLIFEVDRVSHEGSGSAHRASVWITHANRDHYVNFAENVGEGGWQFNRRIDEPGDNGTGTGTAISAFEGEPFNDQGNHRVRMVSDGETVSLYLDGAFGTEVDFPFSEVGFQLGVYARDIDDTVSATFDNVLVGHPAQESSDVAPPELEWEASLQSRELTLLWSADAGFVLEATDSLSQPDWQEVDVTVEESDGMQRVTVGLEQARRFFRLRRE